MNEMTKQELLAIDNMLIKELYVKLELLDWNENPIKEIQGALNGGSINKDGNSSVRRTCNFSFIENEDNSIEQFIQLNTKFRLFIGLKNMLGKDYKFLGDIIWFKQGIFVFTEASFSHTIQNTTINISAQDKMCLLNGSIGGTIPDTVNFHEQIDIDGTITNPLISKIVYELVNHYGAENAAKIYVEDIPDKIKQPVNYWGNETLWLEKDEDIFTGNFYFGEKPLNTNDKISYVGYTTGKTIGYKLADFIYPGELVGTPGTTVTAILDKIKNVLGNFEYFYDIEGNFHFREIKNYLNNSYVPINEINTSNYELSYDNEEIIYSFKDNKKLISSYNNNPNYLNIKNDFVVWGKHFSSGLPIRYHLAIDKLPEKIDNKDWRNTLFQNKDSYYYKELSAEWEKQSENGQIKDSLIKDPSSFDYYLDIISDTGDYGKYSVEAIGRRSVVEVDDDCLAIYANEIPNIIFIEYDIENSIETTDGSTLSLLGGTLDNYLRISNNTKTCFDKIRELMYQHLTLNESISINALPIYYLEPNRLIEVEDNDSRIYGKFMIKSISIPLSYNGTMAISAVKAVQRI